MDEDSILDLLGKTFDLADIVHPVVKLDLRTPWVAWDQYALIGADRVSGPQPEPWQREPWSQRGATGNVLAQLSAVSHARHLITAARDIELQGGDFEGYVVRYVGDLCGNVPHFPFPFPEPDPVPDGPRPTPPGPVEIDSAAAFLAGARVLARARSQVANPEMSRVLGRGALQLADASLSSARGREGGSAR